jgi:carboxymethylenebutenolidase
MERLPGVPPTNKDICSDRLYHEHIAWDQASVLVQAGLLPESLPFPYPLPNGQTPGPSRRFDCRVPAAGVETAQKMKDQTEVKFNGMVESFKIRKVAE